jgi:hypothetical protein
LARDSDKGIAGKAGPVAVSWGRVVQATGGWAESARLASGLFAADMKETDRLEGRLLCIVRRLQPLDVAAPASEGGRAGGNVVAELAGVGGDAEGAAQATTPALEEGTEGGRAGCSREAAKQDATTPAILKLLRLQQELQAR